MRMHISSIKNAVDGCISWSSPYASRVSLVLLIGCTLGDMLVSLLIIQKVPYTEIDWNAYMEEVEGVVVEHNYNYLELKGGTGPLVYPAMFVYIFAILRTVTTKGTNIYRAQHIFAVFHAMVVWLVMACYRQAGLASVASTTRIIPAPQKDDNKTEEEDNSSVTATSTTHSAVAAAAAAAVGVGVPARIPPPWVMLLVCTSRRVHSIFALRLFNEAITMLLLYFSLYLLVQSTTAASVPSTQSTPLSRNNNSNRKMSYIVASCTIFSFGFGTKMNLFLFGPGLGVVLVRMVGTLRMLYLVLWCGVLQVIIALPFLIVNPAGYLLRSFELGRVFMYKWTVNYKCVSEEVFVSQQLAILLLFCNAMCWLLFGHYRWSPSASRRGRRDPKSSGARSGNTNTDNNSNSNSNNNTVGLLFMFQSKYLHYNNNDAVEGDNNNDNTIGPIDVLGILFTSNFIGVVFARSLHYQFYAWYMHTLPYLCWMTPYPTVIKIGIVVGIEICFNIYPSTYVSSLSLQLLHYLLLVGIWIGTTTIDSEGKEGGEHVTSATQLMETEKKKK